MRAQNSRCPMAWDGHSVVIQFVMQEVSKQRMSFHCKAHPAKITSLALHSILQYCQGWYFWGQSLGFFSKKKKNPIKKESPELIKSRETCWDFVLQLSTQQKTLCKTNADIFLLSTFSYLAQLCKTPSGRDSVLRACSPAFQKGQESNQAHPWHARADVLASVPGMQSPRCSFSLCDYKQQLFIVHLGQAREIMKQGLKSTFTLFNFFMYVLRNVAWGCIFH